MWVPMNMLSSIVYLIFPSYLNKRYRKFKKIHLINPSNVLILFHGQNTSLHLPSLPPLQHKIWLNKNSLMTIQLYNSMFLILHTHEASPFYDKHTNRKVMISDMSTHHTERQFQRVQTFLSTVFSQRTRHSNTAVSRERSIKRSPHERLTENREANRLDRVRPNTIRTTANNATTVPRVLIISANCVPSVSGSRSWTFGRTTLGEWPAVRTFTWWVWPRTTRAYTQMHSLKHY